jgi:Asp-tRNA(Asn)/Glu-tRNA(Gln) amidotransferase A subunit family amidase
LLERIDAREPTVRAFVQLSRDTAAAAAEASSARWRVGKPLSPVDGMAIGVKDIIETCDMPTGQGSAMWAGFSTGRDSATVQALREAGAVILGKTTTTEFASTEQFSPTTNPHDPTRTPGGSSSGSAAAVGSGMVPVALGSQVVGSTLRPASYCGAIGFKPTYGALNRSGSYDHLSHSCVGLIGAALEDVWAVARAIADRVGGDPGERPLEGPTDLPSPRAPSRLAVLETAGWTDATAGARAAIEAEFAFLAAQGVQIVRRNEDPRLEALEKALEDALALTWRIMSWEFRWPLGTYVRTRPDGVSEAMRGRLADAEKMTPADYVAALARRDEIRARFDDLAADCDGFVTLSATGAAPLGLGYTGNPNQNVPASLMGVPAISLPLLTDEGLPLGVQYIGRRGEDAALMALAAWRLAVTPQHSPDTIGEGSLA